MCKVPYLLLHWAGLQILTCGLTYWFFVSRIILSLNFTSFVTKARIHFNCDYFPLPNRILMLRLVTIQGAVLSIILGELIVPVYGMLLYHWSVYLHLCEISVL